MHPYYFTPTDRQAATISSFLGVCRKHPDPAADHLRQGYFEPWLRDTGRPDLAELAAAHRDDLGRFLKAAGAKRGRVNHDGPASRRKRQ